MLLYSRMHRIREAVVEFFYIESLREDPNAYIPPSTVQFLTLALSLQEESETV